MAAERLCFLHPEDEPDCWTTNPVGVRNESGAVVPACRDCADRLNEPSRITDPSNITVGVL